MISRWNGFFKYTEKLFNGKNGRIRLTSAFKSSSFIEISNNASIAAYPAKVLPCKFHSRFTKFL